MMILCYELKCGEDEEDNKGCAHVKKKRPKQVLNIEQLLNGAQRYAM